ncbi:MAG: dihydrofolate reductase, partial [Candidatus Marinimicrobia bacterium]|nr:dihydrofolate reductase [Candidatus Neomarinimicrobiota bacterium]
EHFEGDTRFPQIDPSKWEEVEREDFEENGHPYAFSFVTYERK